MGRGRSCGKRAGGGHSARGTALLELALLLPLAVLLLTAGQWASELLVVKLRLREAARFAAWETAATPRPGVGLAEGGEPHAELLHRAEARYGGVLQAGSGQRLLAHGSRVTLSLGAGALSWAGEDQGTLRPDQGGRAARVATLARATPLELPARWGLTPPSWVRAVTSAEVRMPALGIALLGPQEGEARPSHYRFSEQVAVVTDAWFLPDGADSTVQGQRTGVRPDGTRSGLWRQVQRMTLLGQPSLLDPERRAVAALTTLMPFSPPEFDGTFVVDHALGREGSRCPGVPGYPAEALSGLRDFGEAVESGAPRCFGTQPLRDTQRYEASLQLHALRARGPHFMGCPGEQADDPSRSEDGDLGDGNVLKAHCGGGR